MTGIEELKQFEDSYIKVDIDIKNAESIICYWSGDSWVLPEDDLDGKLKIVKMKFITDDKPVADLELRLIFSYDLFYSPVEMVEYVDDFDADDSDGFCNLVYSDEFNFAFEAIEEDFNFERSYSGVLQTLYVYPEYRQNGIGSFIINNLSKILWKHCGWELLCLVTYLNPYSAGEKGKYSKHKAVELNCPLSDPDQKMLEILRNSVVKWGFGKLERAEDHYIKVFGWRNELINTSEGLYFVSNDR